MFELFLGAVLPDNIHTMSYIVVGLLGIFTFTLIVKKIFKLALFFTFITIFAYYGVPDLFASIVLP